MRAHSRPTLRVLLSVGFVAVTAAASQAQFTQPKFDTRPIPWTPQYQNSQFPWQRQPQQQQQPNPPAGQPKQPIYTMPAINTLPGIPAYAVSRPVFSLPSWLDPAVSNPWMNQTIVRRSPFVMNPLFNDPFALNPLLQRAAWYNSLNLPGYVRQSSLLDGGLLPAVPAAVTVTPPVATREPGTYYYKGADLQVNPATGSVYQPRSGVVTLADGTKFYRVPGSGLPTATGNYATGTGLYYDPDGNTFFSPASGIMSKPGTTNVFLPYVW